ncbi:hypothetical protein RRG40_03935 [Mycoplasmopsis felis]|nr:hypothetical protein [Mycoplasmopsis felis]UWV84828.1 hypothetical protein NW066_04525 [Mycoplasmopsis felis]WQQ05569.1 hypothetical protein RRG59_00395 [Mycoplasmopsis felis]
MLNHQLCLNQKCLFLLLIVLLDQDYTKIKSYISKHSSTTFASVMTKLSKI